MVTGELPFPGDGFAEVLIKHLSEPPPLPRQKVPELPISVEKIILHCLAKNRDYRFQSAEELMAALRDPEAFSNQIGNDPQRIQGPMPGQAVRPALPIPSSQPAQMATMITMAPPQATRAAGPSPLLPGSTVNLPNPAAASPVAALPHAGATAALLPGGGFGSMAGVSSPLPGRSTGAGLPSQTQTSDATPVTTPAPPSAPPPSFSGRQTGAPGVSSLLPPPPTSAPLFSAEVSQLVSVPVLASRAQPEMATMIGQMPAAAISALSAPPPPLVVPSATSVPPVPSEPPPAGSSGEQVPAKASRSRPGAALTPPPAPQRFVELQQRTGMFPDADSMSTLGPDGLPVGSAPSFADANGPAAISGQRLTPSGASGPASASFPSQPPVAASASLQPLAPGGSRAQVLVQRARTVLQGLWVKAQASSAGQKFMALPGPQRLLIVRALAGVMAMVLALLLLLLLLPGKQRVVVRSDPDQAEVMLNGKMLGQTPLILQIKKGSSITVVIHKDGYEDSEEVIASDGERGVLISLTKKGEAEDPEQPDKTPDPKNPGPSKNGSGDKKPPGDKNGTKSDPTAKNPDKNPDKSTDKPTGKKPVKKKKKVVVF